MKKNELLNEATIKDALYKSLITDEEARQMLVVYLRKSGFSPMRQRKPLQRQPHA